VTLPAFPPVRPDNDAVVASLSGSSFALHPCGDSDIPFLRALYRQTRDVELALTGWPEATKVAFANSQFDLQHRHFVSQFSHGCFLRLQQNDEHVGRYYLDIAPDAWHVIDIAIVANRRGQGLGSDLLRRTLAIAPAVTLMVATNNPAAMRLYARLGFVDDGDAGSMHRRMRHAS
jgi:ribosomal protein S18 acetylase RimI-like enzyme